MAAEAIAEDVEETNKKSEDGELTNGQIQCLDGYWFGKINGFWYEGEILYTVQTGPKLDTPNLFRPHKTTGYNSAKANSHVWLAKSDICDALPKDTEVQRVRQAPQAPTKGSKHYGHQTGGGRYTGGGRSYYALDDPRAECGYVGLKNQGATCYLNSFLQSLYMTPKLRQAIFEYSYEEYVKKRKGKKVKEKGMNVTYQLQKLFAEMQLSQKQDTTTTGLTHSFGWSGGEVFEQHDVVELATQLFTHLEEKSKDENLSELIKQHQVTTSDYVKCLNCGKRNQRSDHMIVVQLPIEGVGTLEEALTNFTKPEVLDGDNKYFCSVCKEKHDAKKGIRFTQFKEFIFFQFNRWTLDWTTFERKKIRSPIKFPEIFDVSEFLHDPSQGNAEDEEDQIHRPPAKHNLEFRMKFKGFDYAPDFLREVTTTVATLLHEPVDHVIASAKTDREDSTLSTFSILIQPDEDLLQDELRMLQDEEQFHNDFIDNFYHELENKEDMKENIEDIQLLEMSAPTINEQKNEYELYSMLIHRGGAHGGHYFAYIKDPDPKKSAWYEFNDSKVDTITEEEWTDMFSEEAAASGKRESPLTGAYMVLYKRVDPKPITHVPVNKIPEEHRETINEENRAWQEQHEERLRRERQMTIDIHFNGKKDKIEIDKTETTAYALEKIREQFEIAATEPNENFRLRLKKKAGARGSRVAVPGSPIPTGEKTLNCWSQWNMKDLFLEQKPEDGDFEEYEVQKIELKLTIFNPQNVEEDDAMDLGSLEIIETEIPSRGQNIGELRALAAEEIRNQLGLEVTTKNILLLKKPRTYNLQSSTIVPQIFNKDEVKVVASYKEFFVEIVNDYSASGVKSLIRNHFEELKHKIMVVFETFDKTETSVPFDNRQTVGELRNFFATEVLNCDPYDFTMMCRRSQYGTSLYRAMRNNDNALSKEGWHSKTAKPRIRLENRPALRPNQMKVKIYGPGIGGKGWRPYSCPRNEYSQAKASRYSWEWTHVIDLDWTLDEARESIAHRTFITNNKEFTVGDPENIRIRKLPPSTSAGASIAKEVMFDGCSLRDWNIRENTILAIQKSDEPERLTTSDRVLNLVRWYPQREVCSSRVEVVVDGNLKLKNGEMAAFIASLDPEVYGDHFNIAAEDIVFNKQRHWLIQKRQLSNTDWEIKDCGANTTLIQYPFLIKSGDFIVFKHKDEAEKRKVTSYGGRLSVTRSYRPRERGVKIAGGSDSEEEEDEEEELEDKWGKDDFFEVSEGFDAKKDGKRLEPGTKYKILHISNDFWFVKDEETGDTLDVDPTDLDKVRKVTAKRTAATQNDENDSGDGNEMGQDDKGGAEDYEADDEATKGGTFFTNEPISVIEDYTQEMQ